MVLDSMEALMRLVLASDMAKFPKKEETNLSKLTSARDLVYKLSLEADFRDGAGEDFDYFKNLY